MNSFKKFTAALSALTVVMTSVLTFSVAVALAAPTTFTDASSIASWAAGSVSSLADAGVLSGRPDGSFDPQGQLNRAEMAKVGTLAAGLTTDTTGAPHFNDVASGDWYYSFVETLYNNGVVGGINGGALDSNGLATYNPAGTLNRAEGSKILVDAFELETSYAGAPPNFPDVASSAWFYDYVETAYAHGILNGYDNGNFGPADAITREQVAVIAQASIDESADGSKRRSDYTAGAASSVEPGEDDPVVPTSDGDLTVAISASMPAAQTFPYGAASVNVAAYDFTATSDDVVVSSLVVKRSGVGADTGWTLYLYDGANRLTSGKTINSTSHEATFTGVGVTVAAGTTKTLTLKADTSATSTGNSYFEIEAASKVTSNAKSVGGSFPVKSNKQEVDANTQAGGITITKTGSITNPKVGEDNITVAKFKLTTIREAGLVSQIALIVDGTISATDIQNAKLYQGSTLLASVADVNSKDLLVFTLATPFEIAKGDSRNFEVKADFNTGRGADTVKIYLDEATDLVVTGGNYGFGMGVTYGDYDNGSDDGTDGSHSTLQGGDVTISSSGPGATDIAVNAKDVVLMEFNITSVSEVTVKKFGISLTTNDADSAADQGGLLGGTAGTTSNYTDIKIINKDTGAVLMGPIDADVLHDASASTTAIVATNDGDGFYTFQDEFAMAAGESLNLALTCDVANNTGADFIDDTIYASLDLDNTSVLEIKDVNNKTITNSTSVVPTGDITGKTMSVKAASLTVTKSSTPVSNTSVKGAQDVSLLGLTVAAGAASDVKITEMVIRIRADDNQTFLAGQLAASDYVNNIELWIGGTKVAGPAGPISYGTQATDYYKATFTNMDYTVSAGSTIQVVVKGDLSTNVSATTYIGADILPSTDIVAEDGDGNTVTAGGTAALNGTATQLPLLTVSTGGSLTVAVDADTTKENIVVAGTSDVAISKFKFTTTDEAFLVKKLSINNRQSAALTANLGDYDNNVVSIKLSYTNSSGATATKTGYLTGGTADFNGLDMLIDKDDDAVLTVTATLNTIAAGATAGEFVDLNIAFNDFEAVAQGSGETYTGSKIDYDIATTSDLDFGTVTYVDPSTICLNTVPTTGDITMAAGGSASFVVNACAATQPIHLPIGTLLCQSTGTSCAEASEAIMVVTGWTVGSAWTEYAAGPPVVSPVGDTVTVAVLNDEDTTLTNNDNLIYALPGTGYLAEANQMVVYETKPTVTLSSSSPSGSRTVGTSDSAFIFTISADAKEKVQFRTGVRSATCLVGTGTPTRTSAADADVSVDGSACKMTVFHAADTSTSYAFTAGDLDTHQYASFWIRWLNAAVVGTEIVDLADFSVGTGADATTTTVAQETVITADNVAGGSTSMAATNWYFVKDVQLHADTDALDTHLHIINTAGTGVLLTADSLYIDQVTIYNEKIEVDIASDGDFDRTYDQSLTSAKSPVLAYLKEGGATVATGYINMVGVDANADGAVDATDPSSATVMFVPISGTNNTIEISKGTSKTFTLVTNTQTLLEEDAGSDDPVTFSIDLGSSASGVVTSGDIWWNDTNNTTTTASSIKWLGQVDNSTLNGNTLKY